VFNDDDAYRLMMMKVLDQCKVRTFKTRSGFGAQQVCHAYPLEFVPEIMKGKLKNLWIHQEITEAICAEAHYSWKRDHWEFPDIGLPRGVSSTFDSWVHDTYTPERGSIDTWAPETICVLQLQNRGFVFKAYDFSLMESGSGI
jgi:hypothetical protein